MGIQTRHTPSFSVARALLGAGESIRAEAGAMMAMAADVDLDAKIEGGLMKGLKRAALGGESLFITTATAGPRAAGSIWRRPSRATWRSGRTDDAEPESGRHDPLPLRQLARRPKLTA